MTPKEYQNMKMIWILVANQAEAKIYSTERIPGSLVLVGTLTHEEGAAHTRDLASDAPGRVHDRTGSARHSMEPENGYQRRRATALCKGDRGPLASRPFAGEFYSTGHSGSTRRNGRDTQDTQWRAWQDSH